MNNSIVTKPLTHIAMTSSTCIFPTQTSATRLLPQTVPPIPSVRNKAIILITTSDASAQPATYATLLRITENITIVYTVPRRVEYDRLGHNMAPTDTNSNKGQNVHSFFWPTAGETSLNTNKWWMEIVRFDLLVERERGKPFNVSTTHRLLVS